MTNHPQPAPSRQLHGATGWPLLAQNGLLQPTDQSLSHHAASLLEATGKGMETTPEAWGESRDVKKRP